MAIIAMVFALSLLPNTYAADSHWFITKGIDTNEYGDVITSTENYLYVGGRTDNTDPNYIDAVLARIDPSGGVYEFMVIGESGTHEVVTGITADDSGNIYLVGYTDAFTPSDAGGPVNAIFIAKFDSECNLLWAEYIGASDSSDDDYGLGIIYASGTLYVAGSYQGDLFLANIDPSEGRIVWFNKYDLPAASKPISMAYDPVAGNLFLAATTSKIGGYDVAVLNIKASDGSVNWVTIFGGSEYDYPSGLGLQVKYSIAVVGATNSYHFSLGYTDYNAFIAYLDPGDGSFLTDPILLGKDGTDDYATGVVYSDLDGNYYVSGRTYSYGEDVSAGYPDGFVMGITPRGSINWFKTVGAGKYDTIEDIVIGPGNYLYTTGYANSFGEGENDLTVLLASDSLGNLTWTGDETYPPVSVYDINPNTGSFTPTTSSDTVLGYSTINLEANPWDPSTKSDLSKYMITHTATDSNTPDPVPEPWIVSTAVLGFLALGIFLFSRKH